MGFFDLKTICSDCNKEIGLNRFKIKNGWLCPECFKKYKKGFKPGCTLEEIKNNCPQKSENNMLENQENNKNFVGVSTASSSENDLTSLNTLQKLQFRKFVSDQSGMNINDIDSFLATLSQEEQVELVNSFKNQLKTTSKEEVIYERPAPTINVINENRNQPKCPKCGSQQTTFNKQGFGVGKAAAGVLLTGGIGLLAGGIGKNKIIITCMSCGHKWKVG